MRMLMLVLASTSILAAGCGGDRGTATRATSGDTSTAMGTSTTTPTTGTGTRMTTGSSTGNVAASGTVPSAGTPGSGAGAVPPGGLVSAAVLSSPEDVRTVQNRLRQLNFYGGEMSGYWNADTELALRNFQRANGLPAGRLDQNALRLMGLEAAQTGGGRLADITNLRPQPVAAQPAPQQPPMAQIAPAAGPRIAAGAIGRNLDQSSVRQVQQKLSQEGFYRIPVDGIWGPVSQDALLQFQDNRNLQVNGRLTPETVSALGLDQNSLRWKSSPTAPRTMR